MIELPASKSIGARYMVVTFFEGTLPADPIFEDNEDLMVLQEALLEIYSDEEPIDFGDSPIDVGASGTALRFVTAVCASTKGADYVITGTQRLMQRPMNDLIEVLGKAGAEIETLGENECGPYRVKGNLLEGGNFSIRGDISSQFISAIMLVAPYWEKGINLAFTTQLVSRPYIEMTARLMEKFGVKPKLTDEGVEVPSGKYIEPFGFEVEGDWSSASFFYEAAGLGVENIELEHLVSPKYSLQGDSCTDSLFGKIGVRSKFISKECKLICSNEVPEKVEADFKDCPDLMLPFAVACLCKGIKFRFSNVAHLRLKESDRLASLQSEAKKLGFVVTTGDNFAEWNGKTIEINSEEIPVIETYDDHRVAMSFAIAAAKIGEIKIRNPRVVEKSFINFWNQIEKIGFNCKEEDDVMTVTYGQLKK